MGKPDLEITCLAVVDRYYFFNFNHLAKQAKLCYYICNLRQPAVGFTKRNMEIAPCGVVFVSFNLKKELPQQGKAKTILY
jgi:hypothetical protein